MFGKLIPICAILKIPCNFVMIMNFSFHSPDLSPVENSPYMIFPDYGMISPMMKLKPS
jgi:hypothetical protein